MSASDWSDKRRDASTEPTVRDRPGVPVRDRLETAPLEAGYCVGDYVVEGLVGRGGFGAVYRARHTGTGAPAALKLLHDDLVFSEQALARFEREVETLRRLEHPRIVEVFGAGELHDGRPYYAMEWLEGHDLQEELRVRGPLSAAEALGVLEDVGSALCAAHAAGVVHRDLKSTNLIAVPDGAWFQCTLVDFGIAKLLEPGMGVSLRTATGMRLGTPATMAPEQILGGAVDARTDIYALGLLLYQLVTGELPFAGNSDDELERMHLFNERPRASDLAPVTVEFDAVVHRALARDPGARYQRVEDMLAALHRVIDAPATQPSAATRRGIGLCVELFDTEQLDDDELDALEDRLEDCRSRCAQAGMEVVLDANDVMLAALALPAGADGDAGRDRIENLASELAAAYRDDPRIRIRTHVADVEVSVDNESPTPTAGPLLDLDQWP